MRVENVEALGSDMDIDMVLSAGGVLTADYEEVPHLSA